MKHIARLALFAIIGLSKPALAEDPPLMAVFTKNFTNPAFEYFRIGADKVAGAAGVRTKHYVPMSPDNADEQKLLVSQALLDKPDLVLFVPVDDKAMVVAMKQFADAKLPVVTAVSQIAGDAGDICQFG